MKKFVFALLFIFFFGLYVFPPLNKAEALCAPGGAWCNPMTAITCCSKSCPAGFPPRCAYETFPGSGKAGPTPTPTPTSVPAPCSKVVNGQCVTVNTSFGKFDTDPGKFITRVFGILLALSGAIAVILIMRAGYQIMTARGNPEGLQKGREQIVAAIIGLMFIIFSFVFLQAISVDILRIPGFGGPAGVSSQCQLAGGACIPSSSCSGGGVGSIGKYDCTGSDTCCKANHCGTAGGTCDLTASECSAQGGTKLSNYCAINQCCKLPTTSPECAKVGGVCIPHGACLPSDGNVPVGAFACKNNTICCTALND